MIAGRTLQGWLDRADELGAAGKYFDAHEELEAAWKAAEGETKILLQGLIQVAAGLHRLKLDPQKTEGASYLLDRGIAKLRASRALLTEDSLADLETALKKIMTTKAAPRSLPFGLKTA